jgi:hypothetical protein
MQTIVLFRHPAGFVQSLVKLNWASCHIINQFLTNKSIMNDWLEPYRELLESVKNDEGLESKAVLHGCLNTLLWAYSQRTENMTALRFEDLCDTPIVSFAKLFEKLSLPYDGGVRQMHEDLCFADVSGNHRAWDVRRQSSQQAWAWQEELSQDETDRIRAVWRKFNLTLYDDETEWKASAKNK